MSHVHVRTGANEVADTAETARDAPGAADRVHVMLHEARPAPIMVRGAGSWLWDAEGRRYLDFVQGWAVNALGHAPAVLLRALAQQARTLINASPAWLNDQQVALCSTLARAAGMHQVFLASTGAEANEGAVKLARKWGRLHRAGAHRVITTTGSFHGRTLAMMAASGKPGWDELFPPAMPGFVKIPYGDVAAVAAAIDDQTVAVMVEPIQGEGGVVVPPAGYLSDLRALTRARGVLFICDEVQTGIGRTGALFAWQNEPDAQPDIMTLGKGLGGGVPLAALVASAEASCFAPGEQGSTYTGTPLMAAAGRAVLDAVMAPGFLTRVQQRGDQIRAGLQRLAVHHPGAAGRGRGLMWAFVLPQDCAEAVVTTAREQEGLLINAPRPNLLRFMPALNVKAAEIELMLAGLERTLTAVIG
jgi:acetylornithine/N-succinyldiaminopimelate aminotransferase